MQLRISNYWPEILTYGWQLLFFSLFFFKLVETASLEMLLCYMCCDRANRVRYSSG